MARQSEYSTVRRIDIPNANTNLAYDLPLGEEQRQTRRQPQKIVRRRLRPRQTVPLGFLAAGIVLMALLLGVLVSEIQLREVSAQTSALRTQVAELQSEQDALTAEYETALNLTEVEDRAINELGMSKPASEQIQYIDADTEDKAEILSDDQGSGLGNFFRSIWKAISGVF
jgi:cell division protein FtsL